MKLFDLYNKIDLMTIRNYINHTGFQITKKHLNSPLHLSYIKVATQNIAIPLSILYCFDFISLNELI